ncbi:cytochrome P450 [Lophiotrema nucula]|uniref:Cytochrome P450 n=1 Tax=Lophiotrema nucula TaxID=690887 RepID=A0A6A5Z8I1_9PLEO|nr:cytochrome P450 [Lophiotrema nucula]
MLFSEPVLSDLTINHVFSLAYFALFLLFIRSLHRIFHHPLHHIPGPLLPKLTHLWLYYHSYVGDEASVIDLLHQTYGPIVRVSPNEVDISDPDAIGSIYVSKGGFAKAKCYANFDIDGHKTIFSTRETEYRSPRAKSVVPMFSTKSLREGERAMYSCVDRFIGRLKDESTTGKPVNLLNLTRALAVDVVSTHLFHRNYDGTSEKGARLSVSAFVDTFVAVGRFFYLPNALFVRLDWFIAKYLPEPHTDASMEAVDSFVNEIVEATHEKSLNYPGRLLAAGIDKHEVKAQCKDLVFAGTDSTGMNLACICRYLILHPEKYRRLRSEVEENSAKGDAAQEIQALPYLSGVVKEGLRLSMANPTRLPRIVPAGGWNFKSAFFPPGTIVGCAAYTLHFNPHIFPHPRAFLPERWLEASEEMTKSWFAFGAGSRACIARNLATLELYMATEKIAVSRLLEGAQVLDDGEIQIFEWFNSKVKGEKIEVMWA